MGKKLKPMDFSKRYQRLLFDRKPSERRIMILKEHHGERYFAADTPEQICRACLKWLTDMYGEHGHGYYKASEMVVEEKESLLRLDAGTGPDYEPRKPSTPKDEIAGLPPDLQEYVCEQWKKFDMARKCAEESLTRWEKIRDTIASKDLTQAFRLKWDARHREDDDVRFECLEVC